MKTLTLLALLAVTAAPLYAGDTSKNPDRYVSLGMDFTYGRLPDGYPGLVEYDPAGGQNIILRETHAIQEQQIVGDLRAPVNNWLTLSMHGGPWSQMAFNGKSNGYTVGAGFRVYLTGEFFRD